MHWRFCGNPLANNRKQSCQKAKNGELHRKILARRVTLAENKLLAIDEIISSLGMQFESMHGKAERLEAEMDHYEYLLWDQKSRMFDSGCEVPECRIE